MLWQSISETQRQMPCVAVAAPSFGHLGYRDERLNKAAWRT